MRGVKTHRSFHHFRDPMGIDPVDVQLLFKMMNYTLQFHVFHGKKPLVISSGKLWMNYDE